MTGNQLFSEIQQLEDEREQLDQQFNKIQLQMCHLDKNTSGLQEKVEMLNQFMSLSV